MRDHYGPSSEKLTEFDIQPFRGRKAKQQAETEPEPEPETATPTTPAEPR